MTKRFTLILALACLAVQPTIVFGASPAALPDLDSQVRCSMLFAVVAGRQDNKSPDFARFPAMDKPGEVFFYKTLDRVQAERGLSREKATDYVIQVSSGMLVELGTALNPNAAFDEKMAACLPMFEQVAPEAAPKG